MTTFYPCDIFNVKTYAEFKEKVKVNSDGVRRYHDKDDCHSVEHIKFQSSGYYISPRPFWKYSCNCPYVDNHSFIKKFEKIFNLIGLKCECKTHIICPMCKCVQDAFFERGEETEEEQWSNFFNSFQRYEYYEQQNYIQFMDNFQLWSF